MKYVFVFICFLSFFDAESQEFSGMFSTTINEKDASYSAVDNSNADLAVFFINRSKSKVVLLNSATTFQDSLSAKSITKYKKLVAQNLYNSSAQLVYSNNDFSSFLIQIFDFKEKKDSIIKFDFDSDSNCLLQLFYLNDTFYLISLKNSNKNLILTSVSKKGEVTVKELSAEIPDYLQVAVSELNEYFNSKRTNFTFKLQPQGTEFQQKVWQELGNIPFGKTISYMDLAKKLGEMGADHIKKNYDLKTRISTLNKLIKKAIITK